MRITFLGTGTSQGVPFIGCSCEVCQSTEPKDNRLRCSILIEIENLNIVIDTGPDFRYQMLRAKINKIDALLYTHSHKDHLAGLDDIKAYNHHLKKDMPIYATLATQGIIKKDFDYIFATETYPGVPKVVLHTIDNHAFQIGGIKIIPIKVMHYKMEVLGFRIGDFTYITDANYIAPEEIEKIKGSKIVVLNALRNEKHISHFTLNEAIEMADKIGSRKTYFTHISHQLGLHKVVEENLPLNCHLAYDGLQIEL